MQKAYKYGIEIECLVENQTESAVISALQEAGAKYTTNRKIIAPHYGNETGAPVYRIVTHNPVEVGGDGSINQDSDDSLGIEVKIGAVSMRTLERLIPKVSQILTDMGNVRVNPSCGLHCHVSNKRFLTKKYLKRIIHTWLAVEDVFMRTQPRSRQKNHYAVRFLRSYFQYGLDDLPSTKNRLISKCSNQQRYCVMNLSALATHGTIENRLHSATTEARKIVNWAKLLTALYDYCLERYDSAVVNKLLAMPANSDKVTAFFELLQLPPKLQAYYLERISRFKYAHLEREQTALNTLIEMKPKLEKQRAAFERVRNAYDIINRSFNSSLDIIGGNNS